MVFLLLVVAAVCGDSSNYWIGRVLGPRVFRAETRLLNRKHLMRTQEFYEKHGGKTVFLARFAPILRTFAPFVAGIGAMRYTRFLAFSVSGAICWVGLFVYAGYFFGRLPWVEKNFTLVVMAIIAVSLLPVIIELLR
jgi:membrane-associated protein